MISKYFWLPSLGIMMILKYLLSPFFWGFCASIGYAIVFNAGKKDLVWAGLTGGVGWGIYTIFLYLSNNEALPYFIAAFCIGIFAEVLAYIVKSPATVFLIPGLIPLVPGRLMFQTMRFVVENDIDSAIKSGFSAIVAAGAIVLGLALASSFARFVLILRKKIKNKPR